MKLKDFTAQYESFCPKEIALEGDPVGLQVGFSDKNVKKVLVCLDIREQTVEEAIVKNVDLIIAKHPLIFSPLANLTDEEPQQKLVLRLAAANIAVYTSHTNIDIVAGGLNDKFAELLALSEVEPLCEDGLGRIGIISEQTLGDFAEKLKSILQQERLRIVTYDKSLSKKIRRVAICGGSGGKFWTTALEKGADVYVTADIYYHVGHDILSSDLTVIDPGHYMEHAFIPLVAEKLRSFGTDVEILESQVSTNPFYDI